MNRLIQDYLNDSLSGQDLIKFQELMKADKSFAEKVQQLSQIDDFLLKHHKAIMDDNLNRSNYTINGESLEEIDSEIENYLMEKNTNKTEIKQSFKKILDKTHQEYLLEQNNNKPKKFQLSPTTKWLTVAAVFIILCICGIILFVVNNKKYSSQELYATYYNPYSFDFQTRGESVNYADSLLNIVKNKFNHADYNAVIININKIRTDSSKRIISNFILGQSFMGLKRYSDAISCFKVIIKENNSILITDAEWYLGLCYLAVRDQKNAKILFNKLSKDDYYSKKSLEILNKLE